ncbi:thiamine-binding protein [Boudabousia marimammalium]|uniref:Thiamine-binding protein domain-containing protein n=1 Tax=Boudabousia marimammalium TaxID=156892 RepID=A0A1Q5PP22_9ACTO|nr:thiamine-binding protein [Boudabousia marimammalium]OKL49324.1 hypothetical protein BM477_04925 [Boudabousia marimammalium]
MMFQFSIAPTMTPNVEAEMAEIIADAVAVIRASGLPNETNAMSTTIEGEWDECMAVIKEACEAVAKHSPRVSLFLKADIREGMTNGLETKMVALEAALKAKG